MASDLLLKPAERARLAKVREALAQGTSPYAHITNGGAAPNIDELKQSRPLIVPEKDYAGLEKKWQDRTLPPAPVLSGMDIGGPALDPSKLYCSFCSVEVDRINATKSTGPLRVKKEIEIVKIGKVETFVEHKVYFSSKIIACPACVGQLRGNKVEFPETEG